jgi:hypothetical protein
MDDACFELFQIRVSGQRMNHRCATSFKKVSLAVVSLVLTLAVLEVLTRIFVPQVPSFFDSDRFQRLSADVPDMHENIPHARSESYIGVPVRIDNFGLRGDDVHTPKPERTFRIIGIGDSIAFGYGIKEEDTFLKVLQNSLNRSATGEDRYEVLNAGVPATGLDYYYHFLLTKGPLLQPDGVIISICLNDIRIYGRRAGMRSTGAHTIKLLRTTAMLLTRHSQLFLASYLKLKSALYRLGVLDVNQIEGAELLAIEPESSEQDRAWQSSLQLLSEITETATREHIPLLLVVFPLEMQLSPQMLQLYRDQVHVRLGSEALSGKPQARLREFASAHRVPLIDLLPTFQAHIGTSLYLRNKSITYDPVHPSIIGNQITADQIFNYLECSDPDWLHRSNSAGEGCPDTGTSK